MAYQETNWRGLPPHPVDAWDTWTLSREDYDEMVQVHDTLVAQGADMSMIRKMMQFADRYREAWHAEMDAGEDI